MVKKIIILGELNQKHFLPLLLAIYQIINKIFNKYYPQNTGNQVFNMYSLSLGMMSIIFIPCIFKLKINQEEKERQIHKRKWWHYPLMMIIYWIYNITKVLIVASKLSSSGINQTMNPFAEVPFVYIGLEMILFTVASIILLKYKYFIHHIISITGFILFGNFSDLILNSYFQIIQYSAFSIIIQLLGIIMDVFYYYYQKYMMERLFYPYWRISFIIGVSLVLFATGYLIYVLVEKDKTNPLIIDSKMFYSYFSNKDVGLKVGRQILTFILSIISSILYTLNIYYFNPNYVLISFQFSKFVDVLMNEKESNKYYFIIFFIFQLFFLMIYLEIIELNFCDLNKNTKRNIELRSIIESTGNDGRDSFVETGNIDINKDYAINTRENEEKTSKNVELLPLNDNEVIH